MTRFLSAPLLLICCGGPLAMQPPHRAEPAPAPTPPPAGLTVDGKYTLLVTELPFRVLAPAGADLTDRLASAAGGGPDTEAEASAAFARGVGVVRRAYEIAAAATGED